MFAKVTTCTRAVTLETTLHVLKRGTFLIQSSDSYSWLCWKVLSSNPHLVVPIPPYLFSITTFTIQPPPCLNMQSLFLHTCMSFLPYHVTQSNRLFYFPSAATRSEALWRQEFHLFSSCVSSVPRAAPGKKRPAEWFKHDSSFLPLKSFTIAIALW